MESGFNKAKVTISNKTMGKIERNKSGAKYFTLINSTK